MLAGMPQISPRRAGNADEVETPVFEEALVLGRKNCIHEHRRQIFVPHRAPLLAGAVEKVGNQFRFDLCTIKFRAAGKRSDRSNGLPAELYCQGIIPREIGKLRRPDINRAALHRELAEGVRILFRAIPHAGEITGQILGAPRLRC